MPQEFIEDEFELRNEIATAKVSPWGATLTHLVINGKPIINHATKQDVKNSFAGVTLAPWPNRLAGAAWQLEGKTLSATVNDHAQHASGGNANHGLVFDRRFEIKNQAESKVTFAISLGEDSVYPFGVEIEVSYELIGDELAARISAKNHGSTIAPVAFGTHPYLAIAADSKVKISAAVQAVNDSAQIPTGWEPAVKQIADSYAQLKIDDCFAHLETDENGIAQTLITNSDGSQVSVWQDETFKYLMIYTHPSLGIAIEPQTAPANAFNTREDLIWLEPAEAVTGHWGIRVGSEK